VWREYFKKHSYFTCIVIAMHVFFFLLATHFRKIYMGDSAEYIYEAVNIKNLFFFYSGNPVMPIEPEFITQRQPLYPLFLLMVYFFATNNWIVLLLQNIFSVINILYARKIFDKLGLDRCYYWIFALFVVGYPAQMIYANTIAPDLLLQTFALLYMGSFIDFVQSRQRKSELMMGLALIGGMLTKPVLYPFALVHLVLMAYSGFRYKLKLQRTIVLAIIPLCAVLVFNYWNYTRTGKFHFTSNQAFNAQYYFYPYISTKFGMDSANHFLSKERAVAATIPDFAERYDFEIDRGRQLFLQNILPYSIYHLTGALRIFVEPGKAEIDLFTGQLTYGRLYSKKEAGFYAYFREKGWGGDSVKEYLIQNPAMPLIGVIILMNLVKIAGVILLIAKRTGRRFEVVFMLLFIGWFAVAAGPIANTRYFLPVSLLWIGLAVMGYAGWWGKRRTRVPDKAQIG